MSKKSIHVLVVEDEPGDLKLTREAFSDAGSEAARVEAAESLRQAKALLKKKSFDVVLLDLNLTDSEGLVTFQDLYKEDPDIPIVILSGLYDRQLAIKALQNGAQEYISKNHLNGEMLNRVVRYAIERKRFEREIKAQTKELQKSNHSLKKTQSAMNGLLRRLEEEKNSRHMMLDSTTEGIYELDLKGQLTYINAAALGMLGYERNHELVGERAHHKIHHTKAGGGPYPAEECPIYSVLTQGEAVHVDTEVLWRKDGTSFPAEYTSTPIKKNNRIMGAVVTFRDITEKLFAEQARRQKESLTIRSKFIGVVSHELRTPLTAVKESLDILLDGSAGKINKIQTDFLQTAQKNIDRLTRLINDVLDFQKLEAGKEGLTLSRTDINELILDIKKTQELTRETQDLEFKLELDKKLPPVKADKDKITQVLVNLINNAVKFTEKGEIKVLTCRDGNFVKVSVADTGIGIKQEDIPKLFKSFVQLQTERGRKTGSTGLGLAICRRIVDLHRGKIWVESQNGKGSVFSFSLPCKKS